MRDEFLKLVPKRYICPNCGEIHDCDNDVKELEYYSSTLNPLKLHCPIDDEDMSFEVWFSRGICFYCIDTNCNNLDTIEGEISFKNINELNNSSAIGFDINHTIDDENDYVGTDKCKYCGFVKHCNYAKIGDKTDHRNLVIPFGLMFEQSEYDEITEQESEHISEKEPEIPKNKDNLQNKEVKQNKEDSTMKKTTIWSQLYEHSPKENIGIAKQWAEKYKKTLKWAVPVASIYAAYRILNSKKCELTIDNIDKECTSKLGFSLDSLKNKKSLSELMVLGGLSAGAYAAIKAMSTIYGKDTDEVSVEDIETGMEKLDVARKKFGWIQPKTEAMLPVAVSVIIVYVMTQKPEWFEKLKNKAEKISNGFLCRTGVYMDMAKLFVADKLNVDLDNEEEKNKFKKFALLATIVGIGVVLYGKNILGNKATSSKDEESKTLKKFISQIISIMEKLMPTAFAGLTTFLVTKKFLKPDETEETVDGAYTEVSEEDEDLSNETPDTEENVSI